MELHGCPICKQDLAVFNVITGVVSSFLRFLLFILNILLLFWVVVYSVYHTLQTGAWTGDLHSAVHDKIFATSNNEFFTVCSYQYIKNRATFAKTSGVQEGSSIVYQIVCSECPILLFFFGAQCHTFHIGTVMFPISLAHIFTTHDSICQLRLHLPAEGDKRVLFTGEATKPGLSFDHFLPLLTSKNKVQGLTFGLILILCFSHQLRKFWRMLVVLSVAFSIAFSS